MASDIPTSVRFEDLTKERLSALSKRSKIPAKTLIEVGVEWFLDYVDKVGSIPVRLVFDEEDAGQAVAESAGEKAVTPSTGKPSRKVVSYSLPPKSRKKKATKKPAH